MDTPDARAPAPADEVTVAYESGGTRIVAFLDPDLDDSPLRRALSGLRPPNVPPATDPPGEPA